jgi:hypothetical protein
VDFKSVLYTCGGPIIVSLSLASSILFLLLLLLQLPYLPYVSWGGSEVELILNLYLSLFFIFHFPFLDCVIRVVPGAYPQDCSHFTSPSYSQPISLPVPSFPATAVTVYRVSGLMMSLILGCLALTPCHAIHPFSYLPFLPFEGSTVPFCYFPSAIDRQYPLALLAHV